MCECVCVCARIKVACALAYAPLYVCDVCTYMSMSESLSCCKRVISQVSLYILRTCVCVCMCVCVCVCVCARAHVFFTKHCFRTSIRIEISGLCGISILQKNVIYTGVRTYTPTNAHAVNPV
jgi:hypothetical protein